jgi:hypothetical protein
MEGRMKLKKKRDIFGEQVRMSLWISDGVAGGFIPLASIFWLWHLALAHRWWWCIKYYCVWAFFVFVDFMDLKRARRRKPIPTGPLTTLRCLTLTKQYSMRFDIYRLRDNQIDIWIHGMLWF